QFINKKSSTLTYILAKSRGNEALIIDPVFEEIDVYLEFLGANELRLMKAMDTHLHADHITGLGKIRNITRCMTLAGEQTKMEIVSQLIADGDDITIQGLSLKAIYTPGHTSDSYCFYMPGFIFTGDTLFIRGNGRTDFQNGSSADLHDSLHNKVFTLPEDTVVYPGHDYKGENMSTLGQEKRENPRYADHTKAEFIQIMDNLNLPNPKLMDIALPVNIKTGSGINDGIPPENILDFEQAQVAINDHTLLIDLREAKEIEKSGAIPGAKHMPYQQFDAFLADTNHPFAKALSDNQQTIILYCAHGERSALALKALLDKENHSISHIKLGFSGWKKSGGDTCSSIDTL
ncbi:MAG: MBL fold metallo-hydrolase, partial [Methylococcales bacterium]|nr:MBL fold metallo-hydrolase [Methylococcales bacterium]